MTQRLPSATPDWIAEHRTVWVRKPSIRAVYRAWVDWLRASAAPDGPVVEIGSGPGFVKELWPEVIATDVTAIPYSDRVEDAGAMRFGDGEIATLVLVDVFHHLPDPAAFLREAARVLRPGGRLLMIEPWLGLAGALFYRWIHHEGCDARISVEAPWGSGAKDPMEGNAALPYLYFGAGGYLERTEPRLRIVRRERSAGLPWLLSGGFQPFSLMPPALTRAVHGLDRLLSWAPALTATRCFLVVERAS